MLLFHLSHEFWEYNIIKLNLHIKGAVILLFSHRFGKSLIILKQVCPRASFIVAKKKELTLLYAFSGQKNAFPVFSLNRDLYDLIPSVPAKHRHLIVTAS